MYVKYSRVRRVSGVLYYSSENVSIRARTKATKSAVTSRLVIRNQESIYSR